MATGHLNPGYRGIENSTGRYRGGLRADTDEDVRLGGGTQDEEYVDLNAIKSRARDVWLRPDCSYTTYGNHYRNKIIDVDEPTKARPTSAQRKNKPHPPLVFLSTRLHYVPGYHNPDAELGKDLYRVDASVPYAEHQRRMELKSKYIGRPSTSAVNQYKRQEDLDHFDDPVERQAAEAWIKLANDPDKEDLVKNRYYRIPGPVASPTYRPQTVPSLHRYMKQAGAAEAAQLNQISKRVHQRSLEGHDVGMRKYADIERTRDVRYTHRSKRGDYLMHPQWPPSMKQHRLNGLSSVDVPYIPGRR
ncbi:hypothetical protein CAPTEDRAFT_210963 [Capitella teleta]|uniref:Uncharacterized protein n=1 Tax=Capitella teleta TaxID=283909 RepID=R7TBK3_CAPTE|nr:hypothetical protein CAPTEDRAFT_210963 [Capitella teleta]|eukprot:ELT90847.1 hypothetical protein CAPTEDRAFT_210963 [Capitella teleta]